MWSVLGNRDRPSQGSGCRQGTGPEVGRAESGGGWKRTSRRMEVHWPWNTHQASQVGR